MPQDFILLKGKAQAFVLKCGLILKNKVGCDLQEAINAGELAYMIAESDGHIDPEGGIDAVGKRYIRRQMLRASAPMDAGHDAPLVDYGYHDGRKVRWKNYRNRRQKIRRRTTQNMNRHRRIEAGICVACPNPALPNLTQCDRCRIKYGRQRTSCYAIV